LAGLFCYVLATSKIELIIRGQLNINLKMVIGKKWKK